MVSKICLEVLRKKWQEVPGGDINRLSTANMLKVDTETLVKIWRTALEKATCGEYFKVRGWYHTLYKDVLKEKRVLDVGSGFGIDGIFFAMNGAHVTFLDIVESNLTILRRLSSALGLCNVDFFYMKEIDSIAQLNGMFDVMWCQGSLINAPFDFIKEERKALLGKLSKGGRWIELAYPKTRWEREGCLPFDRWGEKTDGGAPWIEWYDLNKILSAFYPSNLDVVLSFEFFNNDFIWFDLIKTK